MKIKLINSYPNLNEDGTAKLNSKGKNMITFRYTVHGIAEELAQYKAIQGEEHYRETIGHTKRFNGQLVAEGVPLYFTQRAVGITASLEISQNNRLFVDTTNMDLAKSLIDNYGEVGMLMAKDLLGMQGTSTAKKIAVDEAEPLD